MRHVLLAAASLLSFAAAASAGPLEDGTIARITDAAFNHGEVVETAAYLSDRIGGRMTNSPAMREAERWTQAKFREWGLKDVRTEGFEFGRGWSIDSVRVRMVAPRAVELHAIPVAWTPGTQGAVTAPIVVAPMKRERDFAAWRGKLAGRVVLVSYPADPKDETEAPFQRLTDKELGELEAYRQPVTDESRIERSIRRFAFQKALDRFLKAEGAIAWIRMSYRENDLVTGEGYTYKTGDTPALPGIELAAEDYRRLARLAKTGPVSVEVNSAVRFDDSDTKAYNVFADLPGSDPKAGYVMAGAHLDSWVAGDGAADNGAGSAVIMEAARILASLGVKPKRTIRFALWAGEEQGLLGSWDYVTRYLARRPPSTDPTREALGPYWAGNTFPVTPLPGLRELTAYFNVDNGSGKLRGLYAEGNLAAVPVLREWLQPFGSLGADRVVAQPTGGTDHVFMARLGLPAFQFIQDPLEYESRVHHSNLDTFDHLRPADLRQAAAVLAGTLLAAANADKPLPREVLPSEPKQTNPFRYDDPDED
jgi:carboxypeptidase Q